MSGTQIDTQSHTIGEPEQRQSQSPICVMQNLNQLKTEAFYLLTLIMQVRDQLNLLQ